MALLAEREEKVVGVAVGDNFLDFGDGVVGDRPVTGLPLRDGSGHGGNGGAEGYGTVGNVQVDGVEFGNLERGKTGGDGGCYLVRGV